MAVAVTLDKVSAGYHGVPVLHDITLSIEPGVRVAIIGRSGAGKSTLLNTIYRRYPEHAALIPQASALVANLSVFHNVFMGCLDRHSTLYNLRTLVWPAAAEVAAGRRSRMSFAPMVISTGMLMAYESVALLLDKPTGTDNRGWFLNPYKPAVERPRAAIIAAVLRPLVRRFLDRIMAAP